jgi:PAS domain S-box-containing protein
MTDTLAQDERPPHEPDFRAIVDGVPSMIFTFDADGATEWVNRAVLDYFGLPLRELQGRRGAENIFHPDEIEDIAAYWRRAIAAREPYTFEQRLRRHDGVYRWFQLRAVPSFDAAGRLLCWYCALTDIDDLKRAEQQLRTDERELKAFLDNIPGLVFTLTPKCEIEQVNARVTEYFGLPLERLRDWDRGTVVHPDDLPATFAAVARTIEFEEPYTLQQRLRAADGTYRWFQPRSLPLRDASGRLVRWYGLLFDIEDLKRAEQELRALQSRLDRATQFAALSQLAASIAHEVNQPLAAAVANGQACLRWLSATPPNLERALLSAERVVRDGNAAAEVVARTRALFRNAPPEKTPLDLHELVREVCTLLSHDLRRHRIELALALPREPTHVLADRVQVQQVVANLVRNALQAIEAAHGPRREIAVRSRREADLVTITVADTGTGFESAERLFEPFFTTKTNGLGVGLTVCRSIVEAHDGRLWAEPNPDGGALFHFTLPCAGTIEAAAGTSAPNLTS